MHICVLGAGVMGLTTAHRLLQDGHRVTLVDASNDPGSGASRGNGAQLSYSYVAPLADSSVWSKWPSYLFSSSSPLTLRPMIDPAQWRWLVSFLAASNPTRSRNTTIHLLRLAFHSRDQLAKLQQSLPFDFAHRVAGKLVMFSDEASLNGARAQVAFQAQHGCTQQVLSLDECVAIEPALAQAGKRWVGGVYTPDEEAGDCYKFCHGLFDVLQQNANFSFVPAKVEGVVMRSGAVTAVKTSVGELAADAFVLALGAASAHVAKQAGFNLPVYPLKGYSISVPITGVQEYAPKVSITDMAHKIVYAHLGEHLRVAGRIELVGENRTIPPRAIEELKNGVRSLFPGCANFTDDALLSPWAGLRPATPTALPLVGSSPAKNLYLNVGQGALGWTLACGSADVLADQIAGRASAVDATPYQFDSRNTVVAA